MHHQRQWWGPENTNNIMAVSDNVVQTSSIILIKILVSVRKPHNHASKVCIIAKFGSRRNTAWAKG